MKKLLVIFVCLFACISCKESSRETADSSSGVSSPTDVRGIDPPSELLIPKPHILSISNAEKGGSFQLSNRVSVDIPENAFVDSSGKPVTGKVDLTYSEYFDAIDILAGGIPMEYDSAGKGEVLQSAGMFDLSGFQSGQAIQIASGKMLTVKMNSITGETDYNWYAFDKKGQQWDYISTSAIETSGNEKKTESKKDDENKAKLSEEKSSDEVKPSLYRKGEPVIDIEIDTKNFPELQSYRSLVWQYAPEVSKEEQTKLEVIFSQKWEQVRIELKDEKQNTFTLSLENGKTKKETTIVPVVDSKEYQKVADAAKQSKKNRAQNAQAEEEAKLIGGLSQSTLRSFGVQSFGLYNCDRIFRAEAMVVKSDFKVKGSDLAPQTVFVVNSASNTVYRYSRDRWAEIRLVPPDDQMILAFIGEGKIAGLKPNQVKSILSERRSEQEFVLEVFPESELSVASLKNAAGVY